jgi:ParB/RepB/Spo0J family partition protein
MRSEVWDEDLDDLARSIEQFGLLQPITIRAVGERYEVIAGHRRLSAHRKLGKASISAIVREADETTSDAMKVHENLYRADVNPVDQAVYLAKYAERAGLSPAELAVQCNRSLAWVTSRLGLLAYPDYLIEMVGEGRLSMASAEILNQIENPNIRESYCRAAAQQGLSAPRARYWLAQAQLGRFDVNNIVTEPVPVGAPEGTQAIIKFKCAFDGQEYEAEKMISVFCLPENFMKYKEGLAEAIAEQAREAGATA